MSTTNSRIQEIKNIKIGDETAKLILSRKLYSEFYDTLFDAVEDLYGEEVAIRKVGKCKEFDVVGDLIKDLITCNIMSNLDDMVTSEI